MYRKSATIPFIYFCLGMLWILFSDWAIIVFIQNEELLQRAQTYKGILFIVLTSVLLFLLIRRQVKQLIDVNRQLDEHKQRLTNLIDNLPGMVYRCRNDEHWTMDFLGGDCYEITGYEPDEFLTRRKTFNQIIHPDDQKTLRESDEHELVSSDGFYHTYRLITKSGEIRHVEEFGKIVKDQNNRANHIEGIILDVSAKKQVEHERDELHEQLMLSQKMESIGRLAGGIAHDFNNLLMVIISYSQLLQEEWPDEGKAKQYLSEILEAGNRASALTRQLLTLSKQQYIEPKVIDLRQIVKDSENLLRRVLEENIALKINLDPNLGKIKADPTQINQVMMNLVVNARDAMAGGGRLYIEANTIYLDEQNAARYLDLPAGHYVQLAVSDTGVGIDKETIQQIFEPFYTTKGPEQGTGLGLSTVYGIVKRSGGEIRVYSEPGAGSTFKLYFPRIDEEAALVAPQVEPQTYEGNETIMLVEDEEKVAQATRIGLERLGYKVLYAASGEQAIIEAEKYDSPIHVLVTDMMLPEMNGYELAQRLSLSRPRMKIVFISGFSNIDRDEIEPEFIENSLLQKPFVIQDLANMIRTKLESGKGTSRPG